MTPLVQNFLSSNTAQVTFIVSLLIVQTMEFLWCIVSPYLVPLQRTLASA